MDDALRPAADASYEAQLARPLMDAREHALAGRMIGRPLRGRSAAAVRCAFGLPAVLRVEPHLDDGTPFPTLFWLACPLAAKQVSRLEAQGAMVELNERVAGEPDLAAALAGAHERYVAARDRLGPAVPGDASAGGMPRRVKCLHSMYAHHLATRDNPVGAWVAQAVEPLSCPAPCVAPAGGAPAGGDPRPRLAAVDVGTNSVRLLVAAAGETLEVLAREMVITRLGRGIDAHGRFDDEALERTLVQVQDFAGKARALGATALRVAATSAVRDARDRERFFTGVRRRAGVEVELLSGAEEAATAFLGATSSVTAAAPYCVLDIGGGSTELIVGGDEPEATVSRQLGCVRLTERALRHDPPTPAELAEAVRVADTELEAAGAVVDPGRARTLVGLAGTVTTLGALHLGLAEYSAERIHGTRVPLERVRELTARLARLPARERARLGPMAPGREDVIVGGALILQRTMERFDFAEVLVSEADILDGLVLGMLTGERGRAG